MEIEDPQQTPYSFKFVDDNAPPHRYQGVTDLKEEMQIISVKWPSNSPDLNLIENVWAYMKDQLYQIRRELKDSEDTWRRSNEIWRNIPLDFLQKLYNDLPSHD